MEDKYRLFEEFSPVETESWLEKINSDLKGEDFYSKLVWKTREGIEIMPFYREEDIKNLPWINSGEGLATLCSRKGNVGNNWLIRQDVDTSDLNESGRKAANLLKSGVDSLGFRIKFPETINDETLKILLDEISPGAAEINFRSEGRARELLTSYINLSVRNSSQLSEVRGSVEADPLGRLMLNGRLCISLEAGLDYLAELARISEPLTDFRTVCVGAFNFANAGGNIVHELAFGLSMGSEYLSVLTDRNLKPAFASSRIKFCFAAGSNYFLEIAKLRVARLLWKLVCSKFHISDRDACRMEIHSVTGRWNKTLLEPYVNMLRTQTEAMSAVLGGADSISAEPYDIIKGDASSFAERIARNQQLILREEAFMGKVADPSGGSYYVEKLTELLAREAWKLFVRLEEEGGFIESLKKGIVQSIIKGSAEKRINDIVEKKEILLGTNLYPDTGELSKPEVKKDQKIDDEADSVVKGFECIKLLRGAEEIENRRLANK